MKRQKIKITLFLSVAGCTGVAQIGSMAHMFTAYGYANEPFMAIVLSVVTVLMSGVFVALGVINEDRKIRWAILSGIMLLGLVEFAGNLGVGGMLIMKTMPPDFPAFFGLAPGPVYRIGGFLFAGFLPIIVFLSIYALAETGSRYIAEPAPNAYADALLNSQGAIEHELKQMLGTPNSH